MEAVDLFWALGSGARFDWKRFGKDAKRLRVMNSSSTILSENVPDLDFFNSQPAKNCKPVVGTLKNKGEEKDSAADYKDDTCIFQGKRKLDMGSSEKKKRNKKRIKETNAMSDVFADTKHDDGIMLMSSLGTKIKSNIDRTGTEPSAEKLEHQQREKINKIRRKHRIHVDGTDIPEPIVTFEQLHQEYNLHPKIIQNIQEAGFQMPTPIQMQAIPVMLHNREILACAPTGSGKTLAFCIPLLTCLKQPMNKGFRVLILSPTRELASQTHRELVKLSEGIGFRIHMINKAAEAAKKFGPKTSNKFDVLVTTPNRLIYLLKQDPPGLDLSRVEWLVVDESDKLFEDGKSGFRDQLATIFLACTSHSVRRAMFSATFAFDVEQWCKLNLDNVVSVSIGTRNSAVETVEQELLFVGTETGKLVAMRDLVKKGFSPPVLVFVQSIERAKELFHELIYEGINVEVIHAERTQQQRDNVVCSFRAGKIWVLICTALMARGIDFKGVNLVINYDFPTTAIEYIHRIGRTGRAGHRGKAITFFTEDDKPLLRSVANVIRQAGCPVPDYMMQINKLQSKQKKRLIKNPIKRADIKTTPNYFIERTARRKKMIQKSKKKKKENSCASVSATRTKQVATDSR
ncbi:probable ATP-dependent RNA helicase DDX52 isoform X2 [Stegostoma tigrinum]|uniref:probable ATP-dependent RNA helicase DDX52 isoform X2 n=1 Tax=Stegostoma tigrinum TaxID=3053191 RepID=UPI0028703E1B|nr:probable ATP-dependent RNA helicase DDX52 isoform X2 [Stegostoma tigrinum]